MSAGSVHDLLNPSSIAVVGASEQSVWATSFVDNLRRWAFPGAVHMVNPGRRTAYGQPCFPSVTAVPASVDHALIVVRASMVPAVLEDYATAGVHSATVIASGFSESGPEGAALAAEVKRIAARHRIELIGPNCYGFVNFARSSVLSRNWIEEPPRTEGRISLVFQSGQLNLSAYGSARQRGIDLRYLISSGNELVTDANDFFEYFLADPGTTVLGGAVERIPDPRRFERLALTALEVGKPIVLLKLGTSAVGQQVAVSHTGSVAGVREVVDTFLRDLGVIVVRTVDELVETAGLLDRRGWAKGPRTVFLGGSGGSGEMFADMVDGTALHLVPPGPATVAGIAAATGLSAHSVRNPVDLTASGFGALAEVVPLLAASGEYDLIVAQGEEPLSVDLQGEAGVDLTRSHMRTLTSVNADGVLGVFASAADRAPTTFGKDTARAERATYLRGAVGVSALHHAVEYGSRREAALEHLKQIVAEHRPREFPAGLGDGAEVLSEARAKALLHGLGVPVTRDLSAGSADEAVAAARQIGFPVVLKVDSDAVAHKSEIGGVVVGLADAEQVREAYTGIVARARKALPGRDVHRVLVCEQIEDATELIVGSVVDPDIGPVVMVGLGGIYVEILEDAALAVPPISHDRALEMLRSLRAWPILAGARGRAGVDLGALQDLLVRIGDLVTRLGPRLEELDLNPVFARPDGVTVGDALIVTGEVKQ